MALDGQGPRAESGVERCGAVWFFCRPKDGAQGRSPWKVKICSESIDSHRFNWKGIHGDEKRYHRSNRYHGF